MFVEHKEAGEVTEAPAKTLKPSQAIRAGLAMNPREEKMSFSYCALGAMWRGYGKSEDELMSIRGNCLAHGSFGMSRAMGDHMGLTRELALQISTMHVLGKPARDIADWLESQGY